jgi:hypothetical protein
MSKELSKYNSKLYNELSNITDIYVKKFEKKHGYNLDYEFGEFKNEMCNFGDHYYFSISDIIFDIETKQPKGLIFQWLDDYVEYSYKKNVTKINYKSYSMGLRYENLKTSK